MILNVALTFGRIIATEQLVDQVNRIHELQSMEKRYHQLQEEKLAIKLQETVLQQQEDVAA